MVNFIGGCLTTFVFMIIMAKCVEGGNGDA